MLADVLPDCADRLADGTFAALWAQVQRIGGCARPIRLTGHVDQIDRATGEIRRAVDASSMPDGTILVPCGNRRASVCPSCSYLYAGDAWQIVHAGVAGGQAVPDTVAGHPGLFVTVTAPSFGAVHSRRSNHGPAQVCSTRRGLCPHGRPRGCHLVHPDDDPRRGAPLCPACHDTPGLVVWNRHAPRLWKRTIDLTYRRLAFLRDTTDTDLRRQLRISYIKVAEAQARGAIHFHAVLRLDTPTPAGTWAPPPPWATAALLATAWRWALRRAEQPCPHPHHPTWRPTDLPAIAVARWGDQADTRTLTVDGGELTPAAVGNYLAKYVTKSVSTSGALDSRIRDAEDLHARLIFLPEHHAAIVKTAWQLAAWSTFRPLGLGRWAHQFGFNGHWITKSRAYSTTFAACRERRRTWARTHTPDGQERTPLDAWGRPEDDEQIITLAQWQYQAAGYARTGDQALADMAADQARSRREAARRDEPAAA